MSVSLTTTTDLYTDGDGATEIPVPYNLAAEESVLGSLLLDRDAIIQAAAFLKAHHFYSEKNAWIYQAVCDLYERREPPDLVTLSAELERRRVPRGTGSVTMLDAVGGLAYLTGLMHGVPTAYHVAYYGKIVQRCARRRRAITIGGKIAGLGYDMGLSDEDWETAVWQVYRELDTDEPAHGVRFADAASAYLDRLAKQQKGGLPPGLSTGIDPLDAAGVYLEDGTLNLLVGRTSGGKTAAALQIVRNLIARGKHVVVLSLEMDNDSLVRRLLSGQGGVEMRILREASLGDRHWDAVLQATSDLSSAGHLTLIDAGITTIDALQVEVQRIQTAPDGGCNLLVVDYLQLVQAEQRRGGNREQEVSSVSRALKRLGRQCRCAVLALSQTSNAAEDRSEPSLRDIRESGAPTHDASVVMYLLTPDIKGQPHWVNCHVLKNRDGERNTLVPLHWHGATQQFTPMTPAEYEACVRQRGA